MRMPRPGPGNGWRHTISSGSPSSRPHGAHLVLEQGAQRLDQVELEVVGKPADVVVALDVGGALAAAGLDHVGVQRALHEELALLRPSAGRRATRRARLGLEDADELAADDLALGLRVGHARERVEEALLLVGHDEAHAGGGDEVALDLLGLALAQQPVVHEHAGELVADGLLHDRGGDGRVHAARQSADDAAGRPPGRGCVRPARRSRSRSSSRGSARRREYRKFSSAACPRGVCLTSGCHCTPAMRRSMFSNAATGAPSVEASTVKPSGACLHGVAVAHPHRLLGGAARQGEPGVGDRPRPCGRTRAGPSWRPCRRGPAPSVGTRSKCP